MSNKLEITSQVQSRCLTERPCSKSGYWFTLAKAESRRYFKRGDIMPNYSNKNWVEVIRLFEGEQG